MCDSVKVEIEQYPGTEPHELETLKRAIVNPDTPFVYLEADAAFAGLTDEQKLYAHWFGLASWAGLPIVLEQTSKESPAIYSFLIELFTTVPPEELEAKMFPEDPTAAKSLLTYAALFFGSCGNFLSFGDSKFLPNIHAEQIVAGIHRVGSPDTEKRLFDLFNAARVAMYSWQPSEREVGYACSGYYNAPSSRPFSAGVVTAVEKLLTAAARSPLNTTVACEEERIHVNVAAAIKKDPVIIAEGGTVSDELKEFGGPHTSVAVCQGYWAEALADSVFALRKAAEYAANDTQRAMIAKYAASFESGSIDEHKEASALWVQDKSPAVETYIGFIETYRDPHGVRAEWEGFVSAVNPTLSAAFLHLVEKAPTLLERLPWAKAFERERFVKPDFTALDVVSFASSGVPAGINIPNYDDVRCDAGFKNVYLANVCAAIDKTHVPYGMAASDWEWVAPASSDAFRVQVGLHELLGHGSGRLLKRSDLPIEGRPDITTCYAEGETYDAVFGSLASSLEECRAECVGLYLCTDSLVLDIFGASQESARANWLSYMRNGVAAFEFYSPHTNSWRQAHSCARFAILRTVLAASNGTPLVPFEGAPTDASRAFVKLDIGDGDPAGDHLLVTVDFAHLESVARPAVGALLKLMTELKAAADFKAADELFRRVTRPAIGDSDYDYWIAMRERILRNKKPRREFVQANTTLAADGRTVSLKAYESSAIGMVRSFVDRERCLQLLRKLR